MYRGKEKILITLVKDGVFPAIYDKNGVKKSDALDTGFFESGTIQGEGKLLGVPSLFIRTSGCNLRCAWYMPDGTSSVCDTPYASFNSDKNIMELDDIIALVKNNIGNNIKHVVITGGEPMLQFRQIYELMLKLKKELKLHITLETNGTVFDANVAEVTDLISLSPKLSSSTPWQPNLRGSGINYSERFALKHERYRYNLAVIQAWINSCYEFDTPYPAGSEKKYIKRKEGKDFQLKFVIGSQMDIDEIKDKYLRYLKGVRPFDIILMPLGLNRDQIAMTQIIAVRACIQNGWRFSPRLHVDIFNNKRNV